MCSLQLDLLVPILTFYSFVNETNFRSEDCQLITITKQIQTLGISKPSYMTSNITESEFPTPNISGKSGATTVPFHSIRTSRVTPNFR